MPYVPYRHVLRASRAMFPARISPFVDEVLSFLSGKTDEIIRSLTLR